MNATLRTVSVDRSASNVVGRVGTLLRAVGTAEPDGASTSTIAKNAGLARPTAHRLLSSLFDEGLIDRDPHSGRWSLGPELYLLGASAAPRYDISEPARGVVLRLAELTGESAFLSARRGAETVCLLREDGSFPLRSHVLHEGIRFPLGVASAGLTILAFLPEREVNHYLATANLVPRWGDEHSEHHLRSRIHETRALGYATNPGLLVEGSWGMGAAVFTRDGSPQWALSLTGVETRFGSDRREELGRILLNQAHILTRQLSRLPSFGG